MIILPFCGLTVIWPDKSPCAQAFKSLTGPGKKMPTRTLSRSVSHPSPIILKLSSAVSFQFVIAFVIS